MSISSAASKQSNNDVEREKRREEHTLLELGTFRDLVANVAIIAESNEQ